MACWLWPATPRVLGACEVLGDGLGDVGDGDGLGDGDGEGLADVGDGVADGLLIGGLLAGEQGEGDGTTLPWAVVEPGLGVPEWPWDAELAFFSVVPPPYG